MRTDRSDRELVIGFVALCAAMVTLFAVAGLSVRVFIWLAGF